MHSHLTIVQLLEEVLLQFNGLSIEGNDDVSQDHPTLVVPADTTSDAAEVKPRGRPTCTTSPAPDRLPVCRLDGSLCGRRPRQGFQHKHAALQPQLLHCLRDVHNLVSQVYAQSQDGEPASNWLR